MRVLAVIIALLLITPSASFGLLNDNSTNQSQNQTAQGGDGGDACQGQLQGQQQGLENTNDLSNRNRQGQQQGQGQAQGQGQQQGQGQAQAAIAAQMQGQKTDQANAQSVNVEGDELNSWAFAAPAMNAEKGTSPLNAYSIFGGIGVSETEEYSVCVEKIAVIERLMGLGFLTQEEAKIEALKAFAQMKDATKPKRFMGFLWKTRGRHLLNGLGLLATDSWIDEDKTAEKKVRKEIEEKKRGTIPEPKGG